MVDNVRRHMALYEGTREYGIDKLNDENDYKANADDFFFPLPHNQPTQPEYIKNLVKKQ